MNNPMMGNPVALLQNLNSFRQNLRVNPQQMVMQAVQGGRLTQQQLNQAQQVASQIQSMLSGIK